ncbi:MAG: SBBP repeat-containing protein [Candidatus Lokiarchaeota archaeon]|nr:SBBP repeat-containing protein [Candidatus Lokiarchaeota archaeon]
MKNLKQISILGLILVSIIFSFSFYNFATYIRYTETETNELQYPLTSLIDPFLYENYVTIGGSYIATSHYIELDSSNNIYITGELKTNAAEDTDAYLAKFDNAGNEIWHVIWGGDYVDAGTGIAFDSSGNVYMGGSTSSFGPSVPDANWFLAKFDNAGNQLWNHSWGTYEGEWGGRLAVDSLDYIYYIGSTWGHGGPSANVGLIKFSSAGVIQWERYWGPGGYDSPADIEIDSSDNIYIVAASDTRGLGGRDVALIKYDSAGTLQWDTAWGSTGYDQPRGITLDNSGNIYITGSTDSFGVGGYDIFVAKFDGVPNQLWNFTWGGINSDIPRDLVLDSANNMYIGGYTESFGAGSSDIVSIKYDNSGVQQWNKTWGGTDYEECRGIVIDSSNNTYITGVVNSFNAITTNALILKYNNTGVEEWYKTWDGESRDECRQIAFDSYGNYYVTGFTEVFGNGGRDTIVIKFNPSGIQQWNITWGGVETEEANFIAIDSYDDIYITGLTKSFGPADSCAFLLKYNSTGDLQWNYTWGGIYADSGNGIAFDSSGNVYMGGSTASFGPDVPDANWFLAKFTNAGNQIWNHSWGTNEGEWGGHIAVDSADNIYYSGSTWGHGGPSANVGLIKFSSAGVIQWARYWGPGGYDSPAGLEIDSSDNIYIIAGSDTRGFGGRDVALIKYNSAGTLQWDTAWGSTGFDHPRGITLDYLGNIYITGNTNSFSEGDYDIFTLIFNASGSIKWEKFFGSNEDDEPRCITFDSSNYLYIGGYTKSFGTGSGDMILLNYEIDIIAPEISIIEPISNQFCGVNGPDFEVLINEDNFDASWYTLDNGVTNITFSGLTDTVDQTEWEKKDNGTVYIKFYIRDLAGFEHQSMVKIMKDICCPVSSIDFIPHSGTNIVNGSTLFTMSASDDHGCGVSSIKYRIDYDSWIDYSSAFTLSGLGMGNHQIEFYSIDDLDNTEDIQNLYVQLIDLEVIPDIIGGYDLLLLISLIGVISLILLRKKIKLKF